MHPDWRGRNRGAMRRDGRPGGNASGSITSGPSSSGSTRKRQPGCAGGSWSWRATSRVVPRFRRPRFLSRRFTSIEQLGAFGFLDAVCVREDRSVTPDSTTAGDPVNDSYALGIAGRFASSAMPATDGQGRVRVGLRGRPGPRPEQPPSGWPSPKLDPAGKWLICRL